MSQRESTGAAPALQRELLLTKDADVFGKAEELCNTHSSSENPSSPTTFRDQAIARHKANAQLLHKIIQAGQYESDSPWGPAWPNSCRWLLSCKAKLHALTPTHDSKERAEILGGTAFSRAYFGIDAAIPDGGLYSESRGDRTNVVVRDEEMLAFRESKKIAIIDPIAHSLEEVKGTIVHEIQHEADHTSAASAFDNYRGEFNANWIANTFRKEPAETGTAPLKLNPLDGAPISGLDNARQQAILLNLIAHFGTYPYVHLGWKLFPKFREHVRNLKSPKGINLLNSPRVDDLYLALTKQPPDVRLAKQCLTLLTSDDLAGIAGPGMRDHWWRLIGNLPASDRLDFADKLALPHSDPPTSLTQPDFPTQASDFALSTIGIILRHLLN